MSSTNIYTITEQQRLSFKPTHLYIKQHQITGLKYFGKTIKNPIKYNGSGGHWKNHIKKHGKQIDTIWVHLFTDIDELVSVALALSEMYDIVDSPFWANSMPENGLDGFPTGQPQTTKSKQIISIKQKNNWNKPNSNFNQNRNKKCSLKKKEQWEDQTSIYNSQDFKENRRKRKQQLYILQSPGGEIFTIKGLKQFCELNNLSQQNMYQVAKGNRPHHKGWKCKKAI